MIHPGCGPETAGGRLRRERRGGADENKYKWGTSHIQATIAPLRSISAPGTIVKSLTGRRIAPGKVARQPGGRRGEIQSFNVGCPDIHGMSRYSPIFNGSLHICRAWPTICRQFAAPRARRRWLCRDPRIGRNRAGEWRIDKCMAGPRLAQSRSSIRTANIHRKPQHVLSPHTRKIR